MGESRNTSLLSQQCRIEYNRLEFSKQHQHIELKSRDNRVVGNTSVQGRTIANVYSRHGPANYFALNWMIGSGSVIGAADLGTVMIMTMAGWPFAVARSAATSSAPAPRASSTPRTRSSPWMMARSTSAGTRGAGLVAPQRTVIEDSYGPISQAIPTLYTTRPLTLEPPAGILRQLVAPSDVGQLWS